MNNQYIDSFIASHYLSKILSSKVDLITIFKIMDDKKLLYTILENLSVENLKKFFKQVDFFRKSIVKSDLFLDENFSVNDDPVFCLTIIINNKINS